MTLAAGGMLSTNKQTDTSLLQNHGSFLISKFRTDQSTHWAKCFSVQTSKLPQILLCSHAKSRDGNVDSDQKSPIAPLDTQAEACADLESFFRGGQNLITFLLFFS